MLPFVVAAGGHNYIYSLCLKEMDNLKNPAPYVYHYFTKGQYGVRINLGHSNLSLLIWLMMQAYKIDVNESAKFQVPRCATCKGNDTKCGQVIPVWTLVENNGCDKSDTDDSEQSL